MSFYALADHEYRYRPEGGEFTAWTSCTVKPIPVGDINIAVGDLQVRVKADPGTNRLAGLILSNAEPFTMAPPPENVAPVANAGADNSITLPVDSVTLAGSGTDSDGTITAYLWEQLIGPNTATISNAAIAQPTASGLIEGTYQFRLTVTDNDGATHQDTVQITVNAAVPTAPENGEADSLANMGYFTPAPGSTAADYEQEYTAI